MLVGAAILYHCHVMAKKMASYSKSSVKPASVRKVTVAKPAPRSKASAKKR